MNAAELVKALDPERRQSNDALLEIFNVGIGASAAALSEKVSDEVVLNLPALPPCPAPRVYQSAGPARSTHGRTRSATAR